MVFNGSIQSDFLKLVEVTDAKKTDLIDYSGNDFISLRDNLIKYIKAVYPLEYQNFSESDLGMMLIELVSYMGAVLSMKADLLANENYIATSKNRNNVKKLLELIGVKLKGPISAVANAELTLTPQSVELQHTLTPQTRVITITSPEDNKPLNFTLYKVVNGQLDAPTENGNIILEASESEGAANSVFKNLALIEGAFVTQSGQFNNNDTIRTISLTESPVVQNSVDVFITTNDSAASGAWTLVDNLYFASGGGDNIFEVVYDDNYGATVIFGDGRNGRIPPVGSNYFVTYRVGGGTRGNIKKEVINASILTDEGITGVLENISMATGGSDAETVDQAKKYAPLTFKRQDRLVTAEDFSVFANTFVGDAGSTGKARAVVRDAYSSANIIDLYLLQVASPFQLQQATVAFKAELLNAIQEKKMLTDEVVIVDGLIRALDLIITVRVDKYLLPREEEIKGKVRRRVLRFFSVNNFDFGKPFVLGDLNREVFTLPEVRYSTVDNLDSDVTVDFNEIIQLNNLVINVVGV